jgi:hypothetical protein
MRWVEPKTIAQQDLQSLHRVRQVTVRQSTLLANHIRGTLPGSRRSTRLAFASPSVRLKGDARSAENDWLRAGKRAMCVSIFRREQSAE